MALNFPSNPTAGQVYGSYVYNGTSGVWDIISLSDGIPAGVIMAWGSANAPANWLICDGSAVSRSTYASLFSAIGTTYGSGNGTTTFNLPDLRGRVAVGKNTEGALSILGNTGGAETHTLSINEMPSHNHGGSTNTTGAHTHSLSGSNGGATNLGPSVTSNSNGDFGYLLNGGRANSAGDHSHTISSQGGGAAHNNLQPYQVVNYIIKYSAANTPGDSELATRVGSLETSTRPVNVGGTGATSLSSGGYLKGNGTSAITSQSGIPAGDITSGSLAIARGGTGSTTGSGLIPIVPTSVSLSSGSATVSSTGAITFSGANTATITGVFSPAYANYKVIITSESDSTPSDVWLQFKNSGGTLGSGYNYLRTNNASGSLSGSYLTSQGSWNLGRTNGYGGTAIELTLYDPGKTLTSSNGYRKYTSINTDAVFSEMLSGVNGITGSAYTDCLIFLSGSVTFGGARIQFYGYN